MAKLEEVCLMEDGDLLKEKITNMVTNQEGKANILERILLLIKIARALVLIKVNYERIGFSNEEISCRKQILEDKIKEYSLFIMGNYPL